MHFSIISWSNIRTFLIMSRSNIHTFSVCPTPFLKRWLCPCVEMLNYYWTRVGHCFFICDLLMGKPEGEGGFYVDDWMSFPVEPYLCVRGGQPFFLTLKGGVKHFFDWFRGGQAFFSRFCDLRQIWNHLSAAWSLSYTFYQASITAPPRITIAPRIAAAITTAPRFTATPRITAAVTAAPRITMDVIAATRITAAARHSSDKFQYRRSKFCMVVHASFCISYHTNSNQTKWNKSNSVTIKREVWITKVILE